MRPRPASAGPTSREASRREARSGEQAGEHGPDVGSADQYAGGRQRRPVVRVKPERDETLQDPRCVFQVLKRHFARYTPEMVRRGLRHRAGGVRAGGRVDHGQQRPRADDGVRATRSAGPSTASAPSTSGRRRSCRRCWATSAAPAAGSWRCAGTRASRARPTSRRCSTCCPATCRCRTRCSTSRSTSTARRARTRPGFWGNMPAYMVSLLKAYWGDAATAGERLLLRLPAAGHRRPQHLPHGRRHDRGQRARATSWSARTRRSGTPTAGCSGSGWPTSTGSSSATCR